MAKKKFLQQEHSLSNLALMGTATGVTVVLISLLVTLLLTYQSLTQLEDKYMSLTDELALTVSQHQEVAENFEATIDSLEESLNLTKDQFEAVKIVLRGEVSKNNQFTQEISNLSSTVEVLNSTLENEEELLAKYSKTFFLNEHYSPAQTTTLPIGLLDDSAENTDIDSRVFPFLVDMMSDANRANNQLLVRSAFRSFDTQAEIKSEFLQIYGSGANTFSADQGYSEHQLGTAVDFISPNNPHLTTSFSSTDEYNWLVNNAHRYGFTLSYPKGNAYYQYEPWHWRFVGIALATHLKNTGQFFYDLDQREIDTYRIDIFKK